jgi:hemerythrin-like domain-containing protein
VSSITALRVNARAAYFLCKKYPDRLEQDHTEADELHAEVEDLYQSWILARSIGDSDYRRLLSFTSRLRNLYQSHIDIEDNIVFPKAAEVLHAHLLEAIGQEFRARRH